MDRDEFAAALQDKAGNCPDVAFLDNGILRDPLTNAGAVLLMVGESRFAYNGWWRPTRKGLKLRIVRVPADDVRRQNRLSENRPR